MRDAAITVWFARDAHMQVQSQTIFLLQTRHHVLPKIKNFGF